MAGITPAYAGKSSFVTSGLTKSGDHPRICGEKSTPTRLFLCCTGDHPRVCGEKLRPGQPGIAGVGSPPRMRGKVESAPLVMCLQGITPAYAGKSLYFAPMICKAWDHPRICGEKLAALIVLDARAGSPPHMRGKGLAAGTWARWQRITPAYAGKSSGWPGVRPLPKDHPRICGEKSNITLHPYI